MVEQATHLDPYHLLINTVHKHLPTRVDPLPEKWFIHTSHLGFFSLLEAPLSFSHAAAALTAVRRPSHYLLLHDCSKHSYCCLSCPASSRLEVGTGDMTSHSHGVWCGSLLARRYSISFAMKPLLHGWLWLAAVTLVFEII